MIYRDFSEKMNEGQKKLWNRLVAVLKESPLTLYESWRGCRTDWIWPVIVRVRFSLWTRYGQDTNKRQRRKQNEVTR